MPSRVYILKTAQYGAAHVWRVSPIQQVMHAHVPRRQETRQDQVHRRQADQATKVHQTVSMKR